MLPHIPYFFDFIHLKNREDLPHLGLVSLLIIGIIIGVYLALQPQLFNKQAAQGGLVDLQFMPDVLQVESGQVYEAIIAINPKSERVTAVQLDVGYDPASITILEAKNEGYLPIGLKTEDDFQGSLELTYGSTIETQATQPGIVATIKFKFIGDKAAQMLIKPNSQISVSSKEGNVLTTFPKLSLEVGSGPVQTQTKEDIKYPDNLLLEKPVTPGSQPFVRDFEEASQPKPELKPDRVQPGLSGAYIKQLGRDIFIEPIKALNQVIEEKAADILKPE